MIEVMKLVDPSGRRGSRQWHVNPRVYLDHWAFRKISEDRALADRLRRALIARKGTLSISLANITEFSQVTDVKQLAAAEEFIDSLLPHIYFQNVNFLEVIEIEKARIQWNRSNGARGKASNGSPDSDLILLGMFTQAACDFGVTMTARGGLQGIAKHKARYEAETKAFSDLFIDRLQTVWFPQIASVTLSDRNANLKRMSWLSVTEPLFIALCEELYQRQSQIRRNDVNDYIHMLVPVTYNEYVLLDKGTRHTASQVLRRLEKLNAEMDPQLGPLLNSRFASVYSEPDLKNFFTDLETGADTKKTDAAKAIEEALKAAPPVHIAVE